MEHKTIPTTAEVWAVMKASHPEMVVFSGYSNPDGNDEFSSQPQMFTELGFKGMDAPTIGARTTWEKHPEKPGQRINMKHEYWLCVGIEED